MRYLKSTWLLAVALVAVAALPVRAAAPGWLGVTTQATDPDLRRGLDLTRDGLLVNRVFEGSPAERAGLKKGDVILRYDGRSVADPSELREAVRAQRPGETAPVEIWRAGASRTLTVRVAELPASERDFYDTPVPAAAPAPPKAPKAPAPPATPAPGEGDEKSSGDAVRRMIVNGRVLSEDEIKGWLKEHDIGDLENLGDIEMWVGDHFSGRPFTMLGRGRLGVRVEKLTSDLAQALGASGGKGVLVLQVMEDTPALKAGIKAGDVIVRVGTQDVAESGDLTRELRKHEGKASIALLRKGVRRTVEVELPARSRSMYWSSDPDGRGFSMRIPEPGRAPRVYRWQERDGGSTDALREELRDLRRELEELRKEMGKK